MFFKIVTFCSLFSISVFGSDTSQKQHVAISTQSFHRQDVPLYKFRAIHDYNLPKYNQHEHNAYGQHRAIPVRIQYAPLPLGYQSEAHPKQLNQEKQTEDKPITTPVHLIEKGRHVYSTERHLEPRVVTQLNDQNESHKSFMPGHNVEVLPHSSNRFLGHVVDPFISHQNTLQKVQDTAPKYVYYEKKLYDNEPSSNKSEKSTDDLNLFGFLPNKTNVLFQPKESRAAHPDAYSLHNDFAIEKPSQSYNHGPQLHLNIARFYSIANQPRKAQILPIENQQLGTRQTNNIVNQPQARKPHANIPQNIPQPHTNMKPQVFFLPGIIDSHNTLLYPVHSK